MTNTRKLLVAVPAGLALSVTMVMIRLVLEPGADRATIEQTIRDNLARHSARIGAHLVGLYFSDSPPERNPRSQKLIRVVREF